MNIQHYVSFLLPGLEVVSEAREPWELANSVEALIENLSLHLGEEYQANGEAFIHASATVHPTAIIQGPAIIGPDCLIGPHAHLRGGVILDQRVTIGSGCEIKSSIILRHSAVAHLNYIGNSIIGAFVNIEAGAIIANHFNEREDKGIYVKVNEETINTGVTKFGALVGDGTKIGANAVLSPGTILPKNSIVKRLELVDQHT